MSEEPNLYHRVGAAIVLVIVAVLLIIGSRTPALRDFFELDSGSSLESQFSDLEPVAEGAPELSPIVIDNATEPAEELLFDAASLPILRDSSLVPNPVAITYKPTAPEHSFITYTVEAGDTAIGIAGSFGIREETLLGGNEFLSTDAGMLQPGTVLVILPIDGVLHTVGEGETLEGLAATYGTSTEEIIAYGPNNLEFPFRLQPEAQILIPGAIREAFFWEPPVAIVRSTDGSSPEALQGIYVANLGTGSFVWPIGARNITQYYWYGHQAVDISAVVGSGVYAADSGTVTYAAWSPYCYGSLIVINHGNGYETFYAHLSGINVSPGQVVSKGNLIGASGNSGCSSGPHLHFEIRFNKGRYDPLSYIQ